jgi:protein-disulfide isomerase
MSRKILIPVIILIAVFAGALLFNQDKSNTVSSLSNTLNDVNDIVPLPDGLTERALGNPDAPVTVIEYASLSCGHCARFHNDFLPTIKKELIDTGEIYFISRDYPLNAPAFFATKLARCFEGQTYFSMLDILFKNQERWTTSQNIDETLKQIARLAGMSEDSYITCMGDKTKENALLQSIEEARSTYEISSTPTFVFFSNGKTETLAGAHPPSAFREKIDNLK